MKAADVARAWVDVLVDGESELLKENERIKGGLNFGPKGYLMYSYETPIAKYQGGPDGGKFLLSTKKYSPTTSKHQTYVRRAIMEKHPTMLVEVETIRRF